MDDFRLGEEVAAAIVKKENSNLSEQDVQIYCQGMVILLWFFFLLEIAAFWKTVPSKKKFCKLLHI